MAIFGEFETVGESYANTHFKEYVTTVWRARKRDGPTDRSAYALKCIAPRRRGTRREDRADDILEADGGLEFIEVFKQIKKAQSEGARGLAPIHAFGTSEEGAWYVTDFCERHSLKALVNRQGQVDDAALRHVVHSVVTGCLALRRSCSRSHGNLKLSNVLRGGGNQPLRKTPLLLVDPMPVPSATISRLESSDRHGVGGMVHDVFEAQDLKAIGELILQLVEGRVIESGFDYNYPIPLSPAWSRLGKAGESWRELCNQLLDPQLALDRVNLNWLAQKVKPGSAGKSLVVLTSLIFSAGLIAGGVFFFRKAAPPSPPSDINKGAAVQKQQPAEDVKPKELPPVIQTTTPEPVTKVRELLNAGQRFMDGKDYPNAVAKANAVLKLEPGNQQAKTLQTSAQTKLDEQIYLEGLAVKAAQQKQVNELLKSGQDAFDGKDYATAIAKADAVLKMESNNSQALALRQSAQKILDGRTAQQKQISELLKAGQDTFDGKDYAMAVAKADAVLKMESSNPQALALQKRAQTILDELAAKAAQQKQISELLKSGQSAFDGKDYATAIAKADAVLKLESSNPQALALQKRAQTILDELAAKAAQQKQISELLKAGQDASDGKDYATAVAKADAVLKMESSNPQALALQKRAQTILDELAAKAAQQKQISELLKSGQSAFDGKDYATAIEKADAVLKLESSNPQALALQKRAQTILDELAAKAAQQKQISELLKAGQDASDGKDYATAVAKADAVLKLEAGNQRAQSLRKQAQSELDYNVALDTGRKALTEKSYDEAIKQADIALAIKPKDTDATNLLSQAQTAKTVAKQNEEKYQTAMTAAKAALNNAVLNRDDVVGFSFVPKLTNCNFAITMANAAEKLKSEDPEFAKLTGEIRKRLDKNFAVFLKAFAVDPPNGIPTATGNGITEFTHKQGDPYYQYGVDLLRKGYQDGIWLDKVIDDKLKELRDKIPIYP